jgi:DNA-binding CsgD family transcriptional regulator
MLSASKPRRGSRPRSRLKSEGEVILDTVDAAYDLTAPDREWLLSLTKAIAPCFDRGLGCVSYFYDCSDPADLRVSNIVGHGATDEALALVEPVVYGYDAEQVAKSFGGPMIVATTWEVFGFNPSKPGIVTPGSPALSQELIDFGFPTSYSKNLPTLRAVSSLALRAHQPDGRGVFICSLLPSDGGTTPRFKTRWSRVSAHISSAWRLRQRLAREASKRTAPEAILTPSGKLADAHFDPSRGQRDVLATAVRGRERARGPLRRGAPDDALSLWQGLVQGRWTLVDQVDRDGKRFVLARRNEAAAPPFAGLTLRERQIVALALQGLANKLITYTVGLSVSTVATHLSNAARKLDRTLRQRLLRRGA